MPYYSYLFDKIQKHQYEMLQEYGATGMLTLLWEHKLAQPP